MSTFPEPDAPVTGNDLTIGDVARQRVEHTELGGRDLVAVAKATDVDGRLHR